MYTAYVTLYTWDWQPIGQATVDLRRLMRNGQIDRSELDDACQKAAMPLLEGKDIKDVHVMVHTGDPATPEELLESARERHAGKGPDAESWGLNRRTKNPEPISQDLLGNWEPG